MDHIVAINWPRICWNSTRKLVEHWIYLSFTRKLYTFILIPLLHPLNKLRKIFLFIKKSWLEKFLSSCFDQQYVMCKHCTQNIMHTLCFFTCSRSEGLAFSFRFNSMVCIKFLRSSEAFCSASFLLFISSIAASLSACVGTWEADWKTKVK